MASTLRVSTWTGPGDVAGAGASAEGGLSWNRVNSLTGTTPIPIPVSTGTHFSWPHFLGLEVTVNGSTNISNRAVYLGSAAPTGTKFFFKATATYVTPVASADVDSASNGATPSGYTLLTTSPQTYYSNSVASTTGTAVNGQYCVVACGVDFTYPGGAAAAATAPDLKFQYDEA